MAEVEHARQILFEERKAVLSALQKAESRRKRLDRELRAVTHVEIPRLLLRGKRAGVPVTQMADALDMSRQMAHRLVKSADETERLRTGTEEASDA